MYTAYIRIHTHTYACAPSAMVAPSPPTSPSLTWTPTRTPSTPPRARVPTPPMPDSTTPSPATRLAVAAAAARLPVYQRFTRDLHRPKRVWRDRTGLPRRCGPAFKTRPRCCCVCAARGVFQQGNIRLYRMVHVCAEHAIDPGLACEHAVAWLTASHSPTPDRRVSSR